MQMRGLTSFLWSVSFHLGVATIVWSFSSGQFDKITVERPVEHWVTVETSNEKSERSARGIEREELVQLAEQPIRISQAAPVRRADVEKYSKGNPSENLKQSLIQSQFLNELRAEIEKSKTYPKISRKMHEEGTVHLSFTLLKNGEIQNVKAIKSSGFPRLDGAAIALLASLKKFKPIPPGMNLERWEISVPVVYRMKN